MKYQLQITAKHKDLGTLQNYVTSFNLTENMNSLDFKAEIKKTIKFLDRYTVEQEILYLGNNKLKDTDIVPMNKSGLQYYLELKNNK